MADFKGCRNTDHRDEFRMYLLFIGRRFREKNLNEVITKYKPDRILIEPSGVGKLSDVMKSVIDIEKSRMLSLTHLLLL